MSRPTSRPAAGWRRPRAAIRSTPPPLPGPSVSWNAMRPMACPPLRWPSWCAGCWNPAVRPGGYRPARRASERACWPSGCCRSAPSRPRRRAAWESDHHTQHVARPGYVRAGGGQTSWPVQESPGTAGQPDISGRSGRLPSVWPRLGGDLARGGFDRGSGCLEVAGRRRASHAPRARSAARGVQYGGGGRGGRRGGRRPVVVVRPAAGDRLGGGRVSGLPSGAVTFLFSDIEGSTRLVKALQERYPRVLAEHRRLIRAAVVGQAGYEVDTQGDAFFVAFAGAKQAVLCALEVQQALAGHQWPAGALVLVRIGIHTGHAVPAEGAYAGLAVHRAARICAAAVGGQVLVSQATQTIIEDEEEQPGFTLVDLGERTLKDLDRPVRLFQLAAPGLDTGTPSAGGQPGSGAAPGASAAATRVLPPDAGPAGGQAGLAQPAGALAVGLLGPVQVVRAGREIRLGGPRPRAVLAVLVLEAGRVVPADRLVEEVWRGSPPPGAAKTLRSYVSRLRAALDPDAALVARGGGYVLGLDPDLVDAVRFGQLVG